MYLFLLHSLVTHEDHIASYTKASLHNEIKYVL